VVVLVQERAVGTVALSFVVERLMSCAMVICDFILLLDSERPGISRSPLVHPNSLTSTSSG